MTELQGDDYKPHIILADLGSDAAEDLRNLEAAIYTDPQALKHAVSLLDNQTETELGDHTRTIRWATSREVRLEFDDITEDTIVRNAAHRLLQEKRRSNRTNETVSQQLNAELRRLRLALFIDQVIQHGATSATIEYLPEKPRTADAETVTGLSA